MKKVVLVLLSGLFLISCKKDYTPDSFSEINTMIDEETVILEKEIESKVHQTESDFIHKYHELTKEYYIYLDRLISEIENSDQEDLFFEKGNPTPKGTEFLTTTNNYKDIVLQLVSDELLKDKIATTLNTDPINKRKDKKTDWLKYQFEGFPKYATITKLKTTQLDILKLENEFIDSVLKND